MRSERWWLPVNVHVWPSPMCAALSGCLARASAYVALTVRSATGGIDSMEILLRQSS